jgi:pentatricopeptide repeat protein
LYDPAFLFVEISPNFDQKIFLNYAAGRFQPNSVPFVGMLNACASVGALEEGRHVHEQIIQSGCESNVFVGNSLVDMYAKCGSMEEAWRVFNRIPSRDVVSWSIMIFGFVKCGQGKKTSDLFQLMQKGRFATKLSYFCGGAECLCQCRST